MRWLLTPGVVLVAVRVLFPNTFEHGVIKTEQALGVQRQPLPDALSSVFSKAGACVRHARAAHAHPAGVGT